MAVRFRRSLLRASAAGASFLAPVAAGAAELFFADVPIVLTASRMEQSPLDAPAAVTIVDREMIVASGFTEIHDLLRLVPGFLVADWPGGSPTVANHGLGDAYGRRVKVMIDGRTVNSPMWGNTHWQDLPIRVDDIERVEVVRGPNGGAYGANAFQGVVNIITRAPGSEDGATLIARAGDRGFFDHGFRLNGRSGDAIDWRLSGSRRAAVNFRPFYETNGTVNPQERFARSTVSFSASTQITAHDELRLHVGASNGTYERGIPGYIGDPVDQERSRTSYLHAVWTRSFSAESELTLQYFHQGVEIRPSDVGSVVARSGAVLPLRVDFDVDTTRDDLELQFTQRLSSEWQMLVGAGVRRETVRSPDYFNTHETLDAFHAQTFGTLTWQPLDWLKLNAGGTLERHDYSGTMFSPRLALNMNLSPQSSLRLSGGVAYRAPSFIESYAEQVHREGDVIRAIGLRAMHPVDPERVRYVELGYVATFPQVGVRLDARAFRERYERYLDTRTCWNPIIAPDGSTIAPMASDALRLACPVPPLAGYVPFDQRRKQRSSEFLNSGEFVMDGVEFSVDWRRPGWGRLVLSQAFIEIDAGRSVSDPDFERSAPQAMTSLLLIKDLPDRWRASLGYYHNETMMWLNDGDRVPPRDRVDLTIARSFGSERAGNEFAVTAQSVGGRYAEFHEGSYRHEPRLFASLRVSW